MEPIDRWIQVGVVVVGADGRIQRANPAAERITGHGAGELVGRSFAELTHPGARAVGDAVFAEVVAHRAPAHTLATSWGRVTMSCPAEITPPIVVATFEDLTEPHEPMKEHLDLALATAGMAIWEWNLSTGLVRWSQQLSELTGVHGPAEIPYGARSDVVHPDDRGPLTALLHAAAAGIEEPALEVRLRRPDGRWRPTLVSARRDPGRADRVIAALADVSVRHALEEGLRQAQKLEALGQVAAGVAHDFNNLLAVMSIGLRYLRHEVPVEHRLREVVVDLETAATKAAALTAQLLAFSRKAEFQPSAVDVSALVAELASVLTRLAGEGVEIRTELDGAVGQVWADRTQLEQVLMNLVVNARDAMGGAGVITVSTTREGDSAVVSVSDTGPGVPAELQDRIFEPFFTTKDPGKGTGLGLALVASVARQWRGRVELVRAPAPGASFRIVLPRLASLPR